MLILLDILPGTSFPIHPDLLPTLNAYGFWLCNVLILVCVRVGILRVLEFPRTGQKLSLDWLEMWNCPIYIYTIPQSIMVWRKQPYAIKTMPRRSGRIGSSYPDWIWLGRKIKYKPMQTRGEHTNSTQKGALTTPSRHQTLHFCAVRWQSNPLIQLSFSALYLNTETEVNAD